MSNIVDWLWSHVPWVWTTLIVIGFGLLGIQLVRFSNFSHETQQVISRYGGLTPQAVQILDRDSNNSANHFKTDQTTKAFMSHHYVSDHGFTVSTYKTDKNGKVIMGDPDTNYNNNSLKDEQNFQKDNYYREDKNGNYVKNSDGAYVYASEETINRDYPKAKRYQYGTYEEDKNGDYVFVNGAYVKADSDKLTPEQKKGKRYSWINQTDDDGISFVQSKTGHYIRKDGHYTWASIKDLNGKYSGYTRYTWKGNYPIYKAYWYKDKQGVIRYVNSTEEMPEDIRKNEKYHRTNADLIGRFRDDDYTKARGHYVKTVYQTDDNGNPVYDVRGQEVIQSQMPTMSTNYGGKITYTIWIRLEFLNFFHVDIPVVRTANGQVRQGSIVQ